MTFECITKVSSINGFVFHKFCAEQRASRSLQTHMNHLVNRQSLSVWFRCSSQCQWPLSLATSRPSSFQTKLISKLNNLFLIQNNAYVTRYQLRLYFQQVVIINKMKKQVKQLTTSDVMVIIINQQHSTDHTASLRQYLYNTENVQENITQAEQMIMLPDFATKQLTPQQIISYHFDKQRTSYQQVLNYESLLQGIDAKMKKVIENSSQACLLSNQMIGELKTELEESCEMVTVQRKPVTQLLKHIKSKYLAISRKMTVISNMQKTLDVMKFWKETKISSVITIQPNKIQTYSDIGNILQTFNQIATVISSKKQQFTHFNNLVSLVNERKKLLIRTIYLNALNCIINYSNDSDLATKLTQYEYIAEKGLLNEIEGSKMLLLGQKMSKQQDFLKMIEANIQQLTQMTMKQKNANFGLQSLKQDNYVDFFEALTLQYSHYFSNWHKVTTYHLQKNSLSKDYFLKHRTLVFSKMLQKIQVSLKTSKKLSNLGLFRMNKLFRCLNNFMEFGQQWMGKCKNNLKGVMKEKVQNQIVTYSKTKNGQLKRYILEDFARISIEKQIKTSLDFQKYKQFILQDFSSIINQMKRFRENFQESEAFRANESNKHQKIAQTLEYSSLQEEISKFYLKLNTKFGLSFFKLVIQYRLRQQLLTQNPQITFVYQHLQFVIAVLYKTFVPSYMRTQLQNQTYNFTFRSNKINIINNAIFKNNIDDEAILAVNKLRHNFTDRTNFGYLYDFIAEIGNRYQALNLPQNPTLLFNQSQKYQEELCDMSKSFLQMVSQVYAIVEYLEYLITRNAFNSKQQQVQQKVSSLKHVIFSLVLLYYTSFYQTSLKKYYSQVLPIFIGIKFEVKKKNDIMINLKQYRSKLSEVYNRFAIHRGSRSTGFHSILVNKQNEYFYKFCIDMFSRVEKINDDARQILKQEPAQLHKITGIDRSTCTFDTWPAFIQFYLEASKERSNKMLEEAIQKTALVFPIQWWKSNIIWYYNDCSAKEKKQFFLKAVQIYLNKLINLPKI